MSALPIRLVAFDLDGTLLNHEREITPATRAALERAAGRGVVIVPATGRPLANLPPAVAALSGVRYTITSNGAAVWDLGAKPVASVYSRYGSAPGREAAEPERIISAVMPVETARAAFELFNQYNGGMSIFSDGRAIRTPAGMAFFAKWLAGSGSTEALQPDDGRFTIVRDFAEWMSRHAHEVEKMCTFFNTPAEAAAVLPRFKALSGVEVVQGSAYNIEVTAAGVDKGTALLGLAEKLGIPAAQTLAIGDSENDRAMLQKAGTAAVMANGMPHIKQLADIVTAADNDHDGVAEVLRRLEIV